MKKIAIIVNSLRFGGAEVQTVELLNNLHQRGFEVALFSLGKENEIKNRIAPGVRVVEMGKRRFLDFKLLRALRKEIGVMKPDAVLMANSYSTLYGYLAVIFKGKTSQMISIQHTTLISGWVDKLKNLVYRRIINRMDQVVFVCHAQREFWQNNYKINPAISRVIYNGIDLERFAQYRAEPQETRRQLGFSPDEIVIGINANLRPEKKHEDMVDALAILLQKGYPVKLLLIGDGVRRKALEAYIKAKGLGDRVIITGFVNDVRPYLSAIDISALTSVAVETLSIAILESMALGKPVVLPDIGGARELVEPGVNGFVYPAGQVDQLVGALQSIMDARLYDEMGENSKAKAVNIFGKNTMVEKYIYLLKSARAADVKVNSQTIGKSSVTDS